MDTRKPKTASIHDFPWAFVAMVVILWFLTVHHGYHFSVQFAGWPRM